MWKYFLLVCCSALRLFIIPHSHCDPGWLEPVDWYYENKVRNIFNNLIELLQENNQRKFAWSEISFLKMWMDEQNILKKNALRSLIQSGRIEIVGGGFVQNDEANTDFDMIIRQFDSGRDYLYQEFGIENVKVGWQIDPFGHSALTPSLWAKLGFEYLVINRISKPLKKIWRRKNNLEFLWEGSDLGSNNTIFTHILYDHYDFPDILHPLKKELCLSTIDIANVSECASKLYNLVNKQKHAYSTENIMMLYGDDFYYHDLAESKLLYQRIELLRDYINHYYWNFTIKIATPSEYFEAVKAESPELPYFTSDFFPYMNYFNMKNNYWTGYYTTRPRLKNEVYFGHRLARAAEIAMAFTSKSSLNSPQASISLHHDAITGTCRDHVAADYMYRLKKDIVNSIHAIEFVLKNVLTEAKNEFALAVSYRVLIAYNPLNWEKDELFSIKAETNDIEIINWKGKVVKSQAVKNVIDGGYIIYFKAKLPSLSFFTIFVRYCFACTDLSAEYEGYSLADKIYKLHFDQNGMLDFIFSKKLEIIPKTNNSHQKIKNKMHEFRLRQQIFAYKGESSGAYIFHPTGYAENLELSLEQIMISSGKVVQTAQIIWYRKDDKSKYFYQKFILYDSEKFIWKIGVSAVQNEEITVRFESQDENVIDIFTFNSADLRQREHIEEIYASRVGKNMYPVPAGAVAKSKNSYLKFYPKFPLGIGVVSPKSFEFLLQRNLSNDDLCGLGVGVTDITIAEHTMHVELGNLIHEEFWRNYLNAKTESYLFPLKDAGKYALSLEDWEEAEVLNEPWKKKTEFYMGFEDNRVYLSSAVIKDSEIFMRVLNFNSVGIGFDVIGGKVSNKTNLAGYQALNETHNWKNSGEMFDEFKNISQPAIKMQTKQIMTLDSGQALKPMELAAFYIDINKFPYERKIHEKSNKEFSARPNDITKPYRELLEHEIVYIETSNKPQYNILHLSFIFLIFFAPAYTVLFYHFKTALSKRKINLYTI
ncbi:MAN2A1 [Blepharisma stoltei]|uniref:Glycoside hydrolase family 38 central domain-containing protein n=1 Tax=Blepharisma stoltei TaxID=1481888 RepID=A0AAU9K2B6_9CILI|nr:unnamed protein product [Blepharisma stoltei]